MLHGDDVSTFVLQEKDKGNAMIHLYRAEIQRLTVYRTRLDATTNWAVTSTGLLVTFSLSNQNLSHYFFLFAFFMQCGFLVIETRRSDSLPAASSMTRLHVDL